MIREQIRIATAHVQDIKKPLHNKLKPFRITYATH